MINFSSSVGRRPLDTELPKASRRFILAEKWKKMRSNEFHYYYYFFFFSFFSQSSRKCIPENMREANNHYSYLKQTTNPATATAASFFVMGPRCYWSRRASLSYYSGKELVCLVLLFDCLFAYHVSTNYTITKKYQLLCHFLVLICYSRNWD